LVYTHQNGVHKVKLQKWLTVISWLYLRCHWEWKLLGSKAFPPSSFSLILWEQGIPSPIVTVCVFILLNWLRHSLSAKLDMLPRQGVKHFGTLISVLMASLPIDSWTWLIWVLTARANDWNTVSKLPVKFLMNVLRYAWPDSTQDVLRLQRWGYLQAHATTNSSLTGTIDVLIYLRTVGQEARCQPATMQRQSWQ
jgi:hypothetical protein